MFVRSCVGQEMSKVLKSDVCLKLLLFTNVNFKFSVKNSLLSLQFAFMYLAMFFKKNLSYCMLFVIKFIQFLTVKYANKISLNFKIMKIQRHGIA